jgi:undecaprenyl diphosphate synthase
VSLKEQIDIDRLPSHIAIIMDGNGRWAKMRGKPRVFGHQHGVKSVREASETAAELGVQYLTLYAFSTENWNRPKKEIDALMMLLVSTIHKETKTLMKNNIRLRAIGELGNLDNICRRELAEAMKKTEQNDRMTLTLALSYSSQWEIVESTRQIVQKVLNNELKAEDIGRETMAAHLNTAGMPDPELLIRTSGEYRISNFLLWQIAYAELYFSKTLWPDFRKEDLYQAIIDYQKRERRFGKTSEQVK